MPPALLLSTVLVLAAAGGAAVLRRASPALAAAPRTAAVLAGSSGLIWIAALVSLGPIVAWMTSGPALLPSQAGRFCRQCIEASSPFGSVGQLAIPAAIPLALPVLGIALVFLGLLRKLRELRKEHAAIRRRIQRVAISQRVLGHDVYVLPQEHAVAFALPAGVGRNIVISSGTIASLQRDELAAVLDHESAHVRQRHHLWLAILAGTTTYFRWIPFVGAVRTVVPLFLEIAADQAATRATGPAALAGALLKLTHPASGDTTGGTHDAAPSGSGVVLHAAASERVRALVGAPRARASTTLAAIGTLYAFMMASAVMAVGGPYLLAILSGC